ncbi:MAG: DUF2312 domain-containing protein [Planctomycetes bacterium]|nr:DUF2312 domain-containing protein [Planctomycetota bacterium]
MTIGHNTQAAQQLRSIIERLERLHEEKDAIAADIRDLLAESKGNGYCPRTIKQILKLRKQDVAEREEAETILQTYMQQLGMLPLFDDEDAA